MSKTKIVLIVISVIVGLTALKFILAPADLALTAADQARKTALGVTKAVINPQQALNSYRQVHGYFTAIEAKKVKIKIAENAVETASENRKDARLTELNGIRQGCANDVAKYNEITRRTDTRIYTNPEQYLPEDWQGERVILPEYIDAVETCMQ